MIKLMMYARLGSDNRHNAKKYPWNSCIINVSRIRFELAINLSSIFSKVGTNPFFEKFYIESLMKSLVKISINNATNSTARPMNMY